MFTSTMYCRHQRVQDFSMNNDFTKRSNRKGDIVVITFRRFGANSS